MRRALDKVPYSPALKELQINLRKFLRGHPEIEWKELKPFGFSINISTIPEEAVEEFLKTSNNVKI